MPVTRCRSLGFFSVTLVAVTVDHLVKLASLGEVVDSVVTRLFFTLLFALGCLLGRSFAGELELTTTRHELLRGALVAGACWGLLYVGWSAVQTFAPEAFWAAPGQTWALPFHGSLMVLCGVTSWLRPPTAQAVA